MSSSVLDVIFVVFSLLWQTCVDLLRQTRISSTKSQGESRIQLEPGSHQEQNQTGEPHCAPAGNQGRDTHHGAGPGIFWIFLPVAVQVTQVSSKHRAAPWTHFVLTAQQQRGFLLWFVVFFYY